MNFSEQIDRTGRTHHVDHMVASAASARTTRIGPPWWRLPFTSRPWKETAYLATAPIGALCGLIDGGRTQRLLARRLVGRDLRTAWWRSLTALPVSLVFLAVAAYGWSIVPLNLLYPLRPLVGIGEGGDYAHSWGGPTLAGAWAVHGLGGGVGFLFLMTWAVHGLTAILLRIVRRSS